MATVVRMPGVSADAEEAALVEWAVAPGDSIKRGDVIATVETEKAVVDLEAEEDGVLLKTFAAAGESVAIGGPIAVLLQDGEKAGDEEAVLAALGLGPQSSGPLPGGDEERSQDTLVPGAVPPIEHTADTVVSGTPSAGSGTRLFASPLVRRLAAEAGVSLSEVTGSGPNGRIRRKDLEAALSERAQRTPEAPAAVPTPAATQSTSTPAGSGAGFTDVPVSKFRRAVANALTASKQNVPHFYLKATCQVERLLALRAEINETGSTKVTINDFFVKAAAAAMRQVPEMNVTWTGDAVRTYESVDIAVAMATERGLMTPVLRGVEGRGLQDVSAAIKDLATRAGSGTLKQQDLEGGALAISNLGMYGVEEFAAIINPPQVGILAVGAVTPRAVELADGTLGLARSVTVVLSVDHRPVDGALAAQWLQHFRELIENPLRILV